MDGISERLASLNNQVRDACARANRSFDDILLLPVTKRQSIEAMKQALSLGLNHFAENYLQELEEKQLAFQGQKIHWHFIGRLQSKKIKSLVGRVQLIHSVDRVDLLEKISARSVQSNVVQSVLLQVNTSMEDSKGGFAANELVDQFRLVEGLPNIRIEGLMAMPPLVEDPEEVRRDFRRLSDLRNELQKRRSETSHSLKHLSMGTSGDFPVAIQEGATIIRVGTALMGPRPGYE
ncbi:MAG: YggS family pyridoxal phosphate-dependent enzyme [Bdellovibrionaceae bacterium]|nr:YggS family pyridoxal phosphate-dependent enzyme [Pseudobdellovibrionaceae bacterium]